MIIQYTLTMPQVGSWNGKWSGEGSLHAKCRLYSKTEGEKIIADKASWRFRWPDGWGALVVAKAVDAKEAAKVRRESAGFYGYDWMIDSIEKHGKIIDTD